MPYIGYNVTNAGSFAIIDDISGTFNGSNTSFTLNVGGVNITPNTANLLIAIDGVVQQAPDAYTVTGSTINFTGAPASGADFYGVLMGQSSYVENNSIGADELNISGNGTSGQVLQSDGDGTFSYLSQSSITAPAGSLTGNTLASGVTASSLTSVGTIGTGVWQGTKVASAYLDDDTAHLSTNQTFSGIKTFGADYTSFNDTGYIRGDNANKLTLQMGSSGFELKNNAYNATRLTITDTGTATFSGTTQLYAGSAGNSPPLCFGSETGAPKKAIFQESYWMVYQGHNNEGHKFRTVDANGTGTDDLILTNSSATFAGDVGIGVTPSYLLDVKSDNGINAMFRGDDSDSYFAISSDQSSNSAGFKIVRSDSATSLTFDGHSMNGTIGGTWTENSDERLKENVETIEDALSKVKGLRGVSYTLKDATNYDFDVEAKHIGFIAQECEEILPEVVHTSDDEDGLKSISYSQITSVLVEAIKELSAKVEALENA